MGSYCKNCFTRRSCADCSAVRRNAESFADEFDLEMLAVIPYEDWRALPKAAGVYFALTTNRTVLYIGQTQNLLLRWRNNNRRRLYYSGATHIGFILLNHHTIWRLCFERALIRKYRPTLAGIAKPLGPKLKELAQGTV